MSAFAALQGQNAESIFNLKDDDEDEDNDILQYNPNSSDSDSDSDSNGEIERNKIIESVTPKERNGSVEPGIAFPGIFKSNFVPNEINCRFHENHILIALKENEYILVMGQLILTVLNGALLIDNKHYCLPNPDKSYTIFAPQSQSVPIFSSTQARDKSTFSDLVRESFAEEFITIIKLENLFTGLENIGKYYAPFKRFFVNKDSEDTDLKPFENKLLQYSFEIILEDKGIIGLKIDDTWSRELTKLTLELSSKQEPQIFMIIGNKNSGKTTFSKALLNEVLSDSNVSYLDMDPGQSEFSSPYSLTLTTVRNNIFGMNIPMGRNDDELTQYYGFTTPLHQPILYNKIISKLFCYYLQNHRPKGNHLIVNTPGWIKGYGKEILIELTKQINPDKLILLSSSHDSLNSDNCDILQNLTFSEPLILPGVYQTSKYSPAQLRIFNKLVYFHLASSLSFDFPNHILHTSPLRISYQTTKSNSDFIGVNAISLINFDVDVNFNFEDIFMMIDSSIMAMYLVEDELFHSIKSTFCTPTSENLPFYMNLSTYEELLTCDNVMYLGLCMIHSINRDENYLNLYFQKKNQIIIKHKMLNGYKLILVRGEGELPATEILSPSLLDANQKKLKRARKSKNLTEKPIESIALLPYIGFDGKGKLGGVWKVRRNVMRRGHQR